MKKNQLWLYLIPLVLFFASLGISTFVFRKLNKPVVIETEVTDVGQEPEEDDSLIAIDNSMPRTQACPLNGVLYTQPEEDA